MVFSGIVESMGTVVSLERREDLVLWDGSTSPGVVLTVADAVVVQGAELGCSIAVNGTCLTVKSFDAGSFVVGLAPETLRRTNLGALAPGSRVNLERSLADVASRLVVAELAAEDAAAAALVKPATTTRRW